MLVSESVTDMCRLWSDLGPIKRDANICFDSGQELWEHLMRAKSVVVKWTFPSESSGMFILYNNHHFAEDSSYTMTTTMTTPMMNIAVLRLRWTTPYEFFVRQPVWTLAAESKGRIHVLQHVVPFCHPTLRFKILSFMITLYNNKLILNTVPWRSVLKVQYCFHSFW